MMLAAQADTPIARLVINDVGPFIPKAALERIASYVGRDPQFADLEEAERYFRVTYASFGALTDEQWRGLTETSLRPVAGGFRPSYDPKIGEALRAQPLADVDLWPLWAAIQKRDTGVARRKL